MGKVIDPMLLPNFGLKNMFHLQLVKNNKQQKEQDSLDNDYVSVVESDFPFFDFLVNVLVLLRTPVKGVDFYPGGRLICQFSGTRAAL